MMNAEQYAYDRLTNLCRDLAADLTPTTMVAIVRDLEDAQTPVPADVAVLLRLLRRQLSVMGMIA